MCSFESASTPTTQENAQLFDISVPVLNQSLKHCELDNSEFGELVDFTKSYILRNNIGKSEVLKTVKNESNDLDLLPKDSDLDEINQDLCESSQRSKKTSYLLANNKITGTFLDQVEKLFKTAHTNNTELTRRRDVVSKGILRAFRKFITSILKVNKKTLRSIKVSDDTMKTLIIERAESVGLIDTSEQELCSPAYVNLVYWLYISKSTNKPKWFSSVMNPSIKVMQDVLNNYTHQKLEKVFDDLEVRKVFSYFLEHGRQQVIDGQPAVNEDVYQERLEEFAYHFGI